LSAPLLWIFVPGILAILLFFLRRWQKATAITGFLIALVLAGLAWKMPLSEIISLGPWSFEFLESMNVLGRQLVLAEYIRPILALIYLMTAFWIGGALTARSGPLFVPLGLGIVSLLTAALAVKPFLYAALLIQIAVFMSVPLLSAPGKPVGRGVLRFLTFQTVGTPFILISGWLITGTSVAPGDTASFLLTIIPLGFGFSFLLAVFPFHTWVSMLAEEAHPYAAAFVLFLLPGIISLFGLGFFESYSWMRNSTQIFTVLRLTGVLMVVAGGGMAAFQTHLGRMLGYAVTVDIGLSLIAIGLHQGINIASTGFSASLSIFFTLFLSRGVSLGVWALALSAIREKSRGMSFREVQGIGRVLPLAAAATVLAHFSIAGYPLLAGFPPRMALFTELARLSPGLTFWSLAGSIGLLAGGLRSLAVLVMGKQNEPWKINERGILLILLGLGLAALFLAGLYPLV